MIRTILFDLEGTLVDVSRIDSLRESRRWKEYAKNAGKTWLYAGISEMMNEFRLRGGKIGIVTNIPSYPAQNLISLHGIMSDSLICFHDVPRGLHKPHPAMCYKALERIGSVHTEAVGVGDQMADYGAFHGAGITAFCAGWNLHSDRSAGWDKILDEPANLLNIITDQG